MSCTQTSAFVWKGMRSGQADLLLSPGPAVVPHKLPMHALSSIDQQAMPAVQAQVDAAGAPVLAGFRAARPEEQQAPAVAVQRVVNVVLLPGVLNAPFCFAMLCSGLARAACSLAAVQVLLPEGRRQPRLHSWP